MGEIIAPGVSISESIVGNEIPVTTLKSLQNERPHELVILYGGSTNKNFRQVVREKWGEELARRGFTVHCFDFRSNLPDKDFYHFGLWDRLLDATMVVSWLHQRNKFPLALIGVSMGGHLAVQLAAELGDGLANLILVAPGAYHHDALRPGLKFSPKPKEGEEPGEFTRILLRPDGCPEGCWKQGKVFEMAEDVRARTLIIHFFHDEVVNGIPLRYWDVMCRRYPENRKDVVIQGSPGGHAGMFTEPNKIKHILDEISSFLTGPSR